MIYNIKPIVIIILILHCNIFSHPIHSTITSFNCGKNNKNIEITMKIFTNDLEKVIREIQGPDLIIDSEKSDYNIDSLIFTYIEQNLVLTIDGNRKQFLWVGKEIENDLTWCYLEIVNIDNFSKILIENKLFISEFDDQLNICHFYCSEKPETIMLHQKTISGEINY